MCRLVFLIFSVHLLSVPAYRVISNQAGQMAWGMSCGPAAMMPHTQKRIAGHDLHLLGLVRWHLDSSLHMIVA